MSGRSKLFGLLLLLAFACFGCSNSPGRPASDAIPIDPEDISNFDSLYAHNCAGCHGPYGKGGASIALADPVYLAIADDSALRNVTTNGVAGTLMPAFAKTAGGMLTDQQIEVIVRGIREQWSKPDALRGENVPPYSAPNPGDASHGSGVFSAYCASCHGPEGRGGPKASSIVDGSYLALVSNQGLRTAVIVGRPELGAPDWRDDVPGKPMSAQDVSDVVAWLASQRAKYPGQPYQHSEKSVGELR
ncbi:MAG TPA: c-type cytochrome [Candidatus Angelobacter sp.]|jgi:mono/diheme cytochrome c family protein|nr:c-type cytochrome [Candidatus Angelobacter sp.]